MAWLKSRRFNYSFYKTISFWLGVILMPETINDLFLRHIYTFANWGILLVIVMLMLDSFLVKRDK